jgi:hypothetical protein
MLDVYRKAHPHAIDAQQSRSSDETVLTYGRFDIYSLRNRGSVPAISEEVYMPPYKLSLRAGEYEKSLNALRQCIDKNRSGYFDVQPLLPDLQAEIHLQLKCTNLYIIGFKGIGQAEYHFEGEEDGWGESCGVKGNYNNLPMVDTIDLSKDDAIKGHASVLNLELLTFFKKGKPLDAKLIVVAAAVVSESLRFRPVAALFAELFDRKRAEVPLIDLKDRYFVNWAELSQKNDPVVLLKHIPSASVASSSSRR